MSRENLYHIISKIVKENCGIKYTENTYFQLDSRIDSLKKCFTCASDEDLYKILNGRLTQEQSMILIDLATNNETYFFRDPSVFKVLESDVFPKLISEKKQKIDIWSLASSTGQEAYSILMTWEKLVKKEGCEVKLHASDISKRVLLRVEKGIYTHLEAQRGLPILDLTKYFKQVEGNSWQVIEPLRKNVTTSEFNLISSHYGMNKYDIIFCRNVLIYQEVEKRKEIINNIYSALKPGGFFVLGNAENLIGINDRFESIAKNGCCFYRKPDNSQAVAA
ncbi:MAG: protein-glutamate O-methyltransferase CheR [Pseudobdellovibrio sp.]